MPYAEDKLAASTAGTEGRPSMPSNTGNFVWKRDHGQVCSLVKNLSGCGKDPNPDSRNEYIMLPLLF